MKRRIFAVLMATVMTVGMSATVWAGDSAGENGEIAFIPPDH